MEERELHLDTELAKVYWNPTLNSVEVEWYGFAKLSAFQEILDKGLALVEQKKGKFWLANTTRLGILPKEVQDWTNDDWFPRALTIGLRRLAMVAPKSVLTKMTIDEIISKVPDTGFISRYFDSLQAARVWLEEEKAKV